MKVKKPNKVSICTKDGFKVFVDGAFNEELTNKYKPKSVEFDPEIFAGQSTAMGFPPEYLERASIRSIEEQN